MYRNNLDYVNIIKLLEKQESKRFSDYQKNYEDKSSTPKNKYKTFKFQKDVEEYKDLFPIKKALEYLTPQDKPIYLLMVNKNWRSILKSKIWKMYLVDYHKEKVLSKIRYSIWYSFLIHEVNFLYWNYY